FSNRLRTGWGPHSLAPNSYKPSCARKTPPTPLAENDTLPSRKGRLRETSFLPGNTRRLMPYFCLNALPMATAWLYPAAPTSYAVHAIVMGRSILFCCACAIGANISPATDRVAFWIVFFTLYCLHRF